MNLIKKSDFLLFADNNKQMDKDKLSNPHVQWFVCSKWRHNENCGITLYGKTTLYGRCVRTFHVAHKEMKIDAEDKEKLRAHTNN